MNARGTQSVFDESGYGALSRPVKLLAVALVVCGGAAIAILLALREDTTVAVADTSRRDDKAVTTVTQPDRPSEPARTAPATPRDRPPAAPVRPAAPVADTWSNTVPGQQDAAVDDEPIPVDDRGIPMVSVTKPEVAEANAVIEPLVRDCITQSGFTGSGTAVLRFTIARQREKETTTSVQDTSVDEEGTTLHEDKLVECLHKTALQMSFPKSQTGGALWATRMVVIENGQLKEHSLIDIGRIWKKP